MAITHSPGSQPTYALPENMGHARIVTQIELDLQALEARVAVLERHVAMLVTALENAHASK